MAVDKAVLLEALTEQNVYQTERGWVADCPVCDQEKEQQGAKKLLVSSDGVLSCMRYAGQDETIRKTHRKAILDALGINEANNFKSYDLIDGFKLRVAKKAIRLKNQVALVQDNETVTVDSVRLDRETDRRRFIKTLPKDMELRDSVSKLLTQIAGQAVVEGEEEEESHNTRYVGFFNLPDGRVGEMTRSGFAVYDPNTGETEIRQAMDFGGDTYMMPLDPIFYMEFDEGIQLPATVTEYGNDKKLMQRIESYIRRYVDMDERDLMLAAHYIIFSYIADKTYELPYFRIVGATGTMSRGSGKSRLANIIGRACYRPFKVTDPSAAATFRIMDKFHPTLVIDEFNFGSGDDAAQLIKILNTGFQRGQSIVRADRDEATGQIVVKAYSPYGAKVVGGLTTIESSAFESRAIRVEMKKTDRRDIEFRTSKQQLDDAAELRSMLTLWRLRNWGRDIETELEAAEKALKNYAIEPRYIQIATPLYAMLNDEELREELALMLVERTEDDAQERKLSMEGYLASIIHSMIFETNDGGEVRWSDRSLCVEDEPSDLLVVKDITNKYNLINNDEKQVTSVQIGKRLSKMMLKTHTIERRSSPHWKKSAVVFSMRNLFYQFNQYALPLPEGFEEEIESDKERVQRIVRDEEGDWGDVIQSIADDYNEEVAEAWKEVDEGDLDSDDLAHIAAKGIGEKEVKQHMKKEIKEPAISRLFKLLKDGDWITINSLYTVDGKLNSKLRDQHIKEVKKSRGIPVENESMVKPLVNKPSKINKLKKVPRGEKTSGQPLVSAERAKKALNIVVAKRKPQDIVSPKKVDQSKKQKSGNDTPQKNSRLFRSGDFD